MTPATAASASAPERRKPGAIARSLFQLTKPRIIELLRVPPGQVIPAGSLSTEVQGVHRRWLRIDRTWPWAEAFILAWQRLTTLSATT